LSSEVLSSSSSTLPSNKVSLLSYIQNDTAEIKLVTSMLYEFTQNITIEHLTKYVNSLPREIRQKIIRLYTQFRENRRHRPGRAFEVIDYSFQITTNYGIFRDLHRHRILTMSRQLLSTKYGYDTPKEIIELGIKKDYDDCMYVSNEAYQLVSSKMPYESQYVVNFAYRYPFFIKMNLREACHIIELRTTPQGHSDYRDICQKIYYLIKEVHPVISQGIKFVDINNYELERFTSEKRIEMKKSKS
jgi:thymidylate synthase ThyX